MTRVCSDRGVPRATASCLRTSRGESPSAGSSSRGSRAGWSRERCPLFWAALSGAATSRCPPSSLRLPHLAGQVSDILFIGDGYPSLSREVPEADVFILLVSGLSVGSSSDGLPLQMLADFVGGRLGGEDELALASKVVRVIVCGDSLASPEITRRTYGKENGDGLRRKLESSTNFKQVSLTKQSGHSFSRGQLELLLSDILNSCPVDLMPGPSDPATFALPQQVNSRHSSTLSKAAQPFHNCLLPNAHRFSTLKATTNPHEVRVGGRLLLGTAGQPVQDILRQIIVEGVDDVALEALAKTLVWGHICPTAPDTLPSVPLSDDPFIIERESAPDIFFAGNQV